MASLASSKKRKRKRKEEHIKAGTRFYVKWNMEDGSKRYFKAFATGKNEKGKFEIQYVEGDSDDDPVKEMRKISTIDDRSETLLSEEKYNNTKSAYPPKKPKIGEDHQVGQLPPVGSNNNNERAKSMTPLTTREIEIMSATPLTNPEAAQDMHESGMSKEGWKGGKTRRRKKKKRRKSRRKTKKRRRSKKRRKMRKNKKTRKRKQKGRGANICVMLSDPNRFGYTEKEVRSMAMERAVKARRNIPEGRCVGKRLASAEAHHYCQEMNDWNDNYKCNVKTGNCEEMNNEGQKKAINDRLRRYGYK